MTFGLLIKPASSLCNLECSYCFYLAKRKIYPWNQRPKMPLDTFVTFIRQYARLAGPVQSVAWQGGEPMIMGLPFFKKVVELHQEAVKEAKFGGEVKVSYGFQTNGTLLNDAWASFFKENHFLVGVSIDGPPEWHDEYRRDHQRRGSHQRVMKGVECLRKHQVPFNVLAVVNEVNVQKPKELLRWFVSSGFTDLQFIPCVEPAPGHSTVVEGKGTGSISCEEYGRFLNGLFEAWLEAGVDTVRIRDFDNMAQMLWGFPSEACNFAPTCGYVVLEHNGDCYPCDFFVDPEMKLGNIHETSLESMLESEKFQRFSQAKECLHSDCLECEWHPLCNGGCPRYRFLNSGSREYSLSYFCPSYKEFYSKSYRRFEEVSVFLGRKLGLAVPPGHMSPARRTERQIPPIPTQVRNGRVKIGRNDNCPCGSKLKYKKCCGMTPSRPSF